MEATVFIAINIITLVFTVFSINTGFVDKYNWYFTGFYWVSLILGSVFIVRQCGENGYIFPVASFLLFLIIVLLSGKENENTTNS